MKCSNCGAELTEGVRFCALCGQKAEEVIEQNETVQNEEVSSEKVQSESENAPKRFKKKLGFKVGIAVIAVAVIAVGAIGAKAAYRAIRKAMMSTAEYYQYVEQKNRDEEMETMLDTYNMIYDGMNKENGGQKASIKLKISDTAKSLLSLTGVDFSKLGDLELSVESSKKDSALLAQYAIKMDNESLITAKSYTDTKEKEYYVQVPELSESYLDLSNYTKESGLYEMQDLSDLGKYMPKASDVKAILTTYTDIVIKNAKNVKEAKKTIKAKKISQEVTEYTVTINEKNGIQLCEDILKVAKDDKNIKNIIKMYSEDAHSEYQNGIDNILDMLQTNEANEEDVLTLKTYVDNDDDIVGRELTVIGADITVKELCPRDDEKFGYELLAAKGETTYFTFSGSGEEESDIVNGEFTVGIDESLMEGSELQLAAYDEIAKIVVKDCDLSNISEGEASATYTITTEVLPQLANYALKIKTESNDLDVKTSFAIMAGKDELAAMEMHVSESKALKDVKPSNSATLYDVTNTEDMTAYEAEISLETFLAQLKEKTGIDFSSLLESARSTQEEAVDEYDTDLYDSSLYEDNSEAYEDFNMDDYSSEEDYSYDESVY